MLARAGDTIADTELAPREARLGLLSELRGVLSGGSGAAEAVAALAAPPSLTAGATERAEAALLCRIEPLLERFRGLSPPERAEVATVVDRLLATMQGELAFFPAGQLVALSDAAALTAYTEGIAGCVGVFWTRLLVRHRWVVSPAAQVALEVAGRRYGRALQLVNILRDLPRDLRRGVCFLPADELAAVGLEPADLLDPGAGELLAPLLARWESRAWCGLLGGLVYTTRLPRWAISLRLATALPAALGLATLRELRASERRLDPTHKISVSRGALRRIVARTALACCTPRGLLRLV